MVDKVTSLQLQRQLTNMASPIVSISLSGKGICNEIHRGSPRNVLVLFIANYISPKAE